MTAKNIGTEASISQIRVEKLTSDVGTPASGFESFYDKNGTIRKINSDGLITALGSCVAELQGTSSSDMTSGSYLDFSSCISTDFGDPNFSWDSTNHRVLFPFVGTWLVQGVFGIDNTIVPSGTYRELRVENYSASPVYFKKDPVATYRYQVLSFSCILINTGGVHFVMNHDASSALSFGYLTSHSLAFNPQISIALIG